MQNLFPLYFSFIISFTLTLFLTMIITKSIDQLKKQQPDNKMPVLMLNFFYWSTNLITIALAYYLYGAS